MWIILGLASIITAIMNIAVWRQGKTEKYYRLASISLTALTMCAFYSDGAERAAAEDWSGLMDIIPAMSGNLWVFVAASILINGITLFEKGTSAKADEAH